MALLSLITIVWTGSLLAFGAPKTLRVIQSADFVTLDWTISSQSIDTFLIQNLQEGLFKIDDQLRLSPALGLSVNAEESGKALKIPLKPGVLWSDGTPLKAQHFIDAWKRLLSPLTGSPYSYLLFDVEGAEDFYKGRITNFDQVGVKAVRDDLIEIKLKKPSANWAWVLAFRATYPIRMDAVQNHGSSWTKPGKMLNLGAFLLESVDYGQKIALKRNPRYHGKAPAFDRVEISIRAEYAALQAIRSGTVDFAVQVPDVIKNDLKFRAHVRRLRPIRTKRLTFNVHDYPTSDPQMRATITALIDRKRLARELGSGFIAASSLVPPGFEGFRASPQDETRRQSALEKLARNSSSITALTLLVPVFGENQGENRSVAEYLRKTLEGTGSFKVKIEKVESAAQWGIQSRSRNFSMILHDWTADYPDSENFYALYSGRSKHAFRWLNEPFDALLESARNETNRSKRESLYRLADELLIDRERVVLPLYYAENAVFAAPSIILKGLNPFFASDLTMIELRP